MRDDSKEIDKLSSRVTLTWSSSSHAFSLGSIKKGKQLKNQSVKGIKVQGNDTTASDGLSLAL